MIACLNDVFKKIYILSFSHFDYNIIENSIRVNAIISLSITQSHSKFMPFQKNKRIQNFNRNKLKNNKYKYFL